MEKKEEKEEKKSEKKEIKERKFWQQKSFWAAMVVATAIVVALLAMRMYWTLLIVFTATGLLIWFCFFWKVGPTETGVIVCLGKIKEVKKSGPYLSYPKPLGEMERFTTKQLKVEYVVGKAVTRKAFYYEEMTKIEDITEQIEKIEKEPKSAAKEERLEIAKSALQASEEKLEKDKAKDDEEKELCESIELPNIGVAVYLLYPTDENLIKTYQKLGKAKTQEELGPHYHDFVVGSLREIVGTLPWRAVIENRKHIIREMEDRFIEEGSPFIVAGFKPEDIYITLTLVELPPELAKLLKLPQEEALKAKAAEKTQKALKTELKGYPEGVDPNVAAMLVKGKVPTVIKIEGGSDILGLGYQLEMGREMAKKDQGKPSGEGKEGKKEDFGATETEKEWREKGKII